VAPRGGEGEPGGLVGKKNHRGTKCVRWTRPRDELKKQPKNLHGFWVPPRTSSGGGWGKKPFVWKGQGGFKKDPLKNQFPHSSNPQKHVPKKNGSQTEKFRGCTPKNTKFFSGVKPKPLGGGVINKQKQLQEPRGEKRTASQNWAKTA